MESHTVFGFYTILLLQEAPTTLICFLNSGLSHFQIEDHRDGQSFPFDIDRPGLQSEQ